MKNRLTSCRACGADIAKTASKCPHCGAYALTGSAFFIIVIASIAVTLFMYQFGLLSYSDNTQSTQSAPIEVSASDLWNMYQENEINADAQYNGKLLAITGEVASISAYFEKPCITIYTGDRQAYLVCLFPKGDTSTALANLRVGDVVSLEGSCSGTEAAGSVVVMQTAGYSSGLVYINKCEIISVE